MRHGVRAATSSTKLHIPSTGHRSSGLMLETDSSLEGTENVTVLTLALTLPLVALRSKCMSANIPQN